MNSSNSDTQRLQRALSALKHLRTKLNQVEQAKTEPDPEKIANWELSISCVPDKVYLERFAAIGTSEDRYINVTF